MVLWTGNHEKARQKEASQLHILRPAEDNIQVSKFLTEKSGRIYEAYHVKLF